MNLGLGTILTHPRSSLRFDCITFNFRSSHIMRLEAKVRDLDVGSSKQWMIFLKSLNYKFYKKNN